MGALTPVSHTFELGLVLSMYEVPVDLAKQDWSGAVVCHSLAHARLDVCAPCASAAIALFPLFFTQSWTMRESRAPCWPCGWWWRDTLQVPFPVTSQIAHKPAETANVILQYGPQYGLQRPWTCESHVHCARPPAVGRRVNSTLSAVETFGIVTIVQTASSSRSKRARRNNTKKIAR
jgi:hypothetical protein